jgi:hypothetical protein
MDGFDIRSPRFARYILSNAALETLAAGFRWIEGPVWMGDGNCLLFQDGVTRFWSRPACALRLSAEAGRGRFPIRCASPWAPTRSRDPESQPRRASLAISVTSSIG